MERYLKGKPESLTELELGIIKNYKHGFELSGFEPSDHWEGLVKKGFLDCDLEMTSKAWEFVKTYDKWDEVQPYKNKVVVYVKPIL